MPGAPIAMRSETRLEVVRNELVVAVDETGLDLSRDAVPVAIDLGGERLVRNPCAAKIAFADITGKRFDSRYPGLDRGRPGGPSHSYR